MMKKKEKETTPEDYVIARVHTFAVYKYVVQQYYIFFLISIVMYGICPAVSFVVYGSARIVPTGCLWSYNKGFELTYVILPLLDQHYHWRGGSGV